LLRRCAPRNDTATLCREAAERSEEAVAISSRSTGLRRRFAPRNDRISCRHCERSEAIIAFVSVRKAIRKILRHLAPTRHTLLPCSTRENCQVLFN